VVQEEVEIAPVLHQFEEVIEEVIEDTENSFAIDADDDAVLDQLLTPIIQYNEPVNNTFEDLVIDNNNINMIANLDNIESNIKSDDFNLDFIEENNNENNDDIADFF
jgi:hypothetical protein